MSATVTSIAPEGDGEGQLSFEGFPVEASLASFSSARNIPLEGKLAYNQPVSFRGSGRVAGVKIIENKGRLVRVHIVEVLEAVIDA